jgi:nucleoside-diphosphate-sugar epimerase
VRVAIAGATGVLGAATVPVLNAAGHEVRGLARNVAAGDPGGLVAVDILDRDSLLAFAREWRPEAFVHLATSIPAKLKPHGVERQFEATNRLRTEGTRNLIDAAREAGSRRFVAQSIAFASSPGEGLADEDVPLWLDGPLGGAGEAIAELERLTVDAGGVVLRFGHLHGPGTMFAADGSMGKPAGGGTLPVIHRGGRESVFSFTHPRDAAAAVLAALSSDATGIFNIVDDDPVPTSEWLPALARAHGAKRDPRRVPAALVRPFAGSYGVSFMTELRGADNAKAKRELGWAPSISWREGFSEG